MIDKTDFIPGGASEFYVQCDVAAAVMSWNTENVKPAGTQTWTELWDMKRFSGQRGFWKQPYQTMEIALMADGVATDKLYPIDVDRALKVLDRIKSDIFWWTSGGQSAQILIDGDIAAGMTWNGRVYDPKISGAPVDFHFNQALFVSDSFVIPRGAKNRRRRWNSSRSPYRRHRRRRFAKRMPYGPVNTKALAMLDAQRLAVLPSSRGIWQRHIPEFRLVGRERCQDRRKV